MLTKFNKVYIEISNHCNLNCSFCSQESKNSRMLNIEQFKHVLKEIKPYTNEITLHILGEPLVHPDIEKFLDIANEDFNINLTTNGFLLNKKSLVDQKLKKINISLNSAISLSNDALDTYLEKIYNFISQKRISDDEVIINLRLWGYDKYDVDKVITKLESHYKINVNNYENTRLDKKVILTFDKYFKWPDINDNLNIQNKHCLGGKSHIGILSDGKVVICCLDASGTSNLGNIFNTPLGDILKTTKFETCINEFKKNKTYLDICKNCNFYYKER